MFLLHKIAEMNIFFRQMLKQNNLSKFVPPSTDRRTNLFMQLFMQISRDVLLKDQIFIEHIEFHKRRE
jgi:hypothetical protein